MGGVKTSGRSTSSPVRRKLSLILPPRSTNAPTRRTATKAMMTAYSVTAWPASRRRREAIVLGRRGSHSFTSELACPSPESFARRPSSASRTGLPARWSSYAGPPRLFVPTGRATRSRQNHSQTDGARVVHHTSRAVPARVIDALQGDERRELDRDLVAHRRAAPRFPSRDDVRP